MMTKEEILNAAKKWEDFCIALRRDFHESPELSGQETQTIALQRLCNAVSGLVPEPEKGSRTVKEVDLLSFLVSRIARSTRVKLKPSLNSYQRCLGCSILAEKFGIQSSPYECSQTAFIVSMTFTLYQ